MIIGEGFPERRRHKRYRVKRLAFAVIRSQKACEMGCIDRMSRGQVAMAVFKSKPAKMGQIIDLSEKGLSFSYIDENEEALDESKTIDILFADDNFYLARLPFQIIREFVIKNEFAYNPITMKRRSVAFYDLTPDQRAKLDYFINSHTIGETEQGQP
jgi:hypothetical protein